MTSFLLIDDHTVVRTGVKILLADLFMDIQIAEAKDGESALLLLQQQSFDMVMLDIQMPNTDTFALMETFKLLYPSIKVLVFSMSPENIFAMRFLKAGALGFISKDAPLDEIKIAIKKVLSGKKYMSEAMLFSLADGDNIKKGNNPFSILSTREFEIVTMMLNGKTLSNIAADLSLGTSTVGTHKSRIFTKLKVTNLLELKQLADSFETK
ncbi:response regulator [Ferruginibacter yonginensis]|uniref:Response regulator n=1 Tax=Ferruginibacter yonginensis TaxID=1310416 RepID=A0ABV8QQZ0_9BACT